MYGVIDVGTTGVKLSIYDRELNRIHFEKTNIGFEKVGNGFVEQNSLELARIVKGYARKAKSLGAKRLGICVYRASVLAWKKDGKPLTNIITWIDGRGKSVVERLPLYAKMLKRLNKTLKFILSPDSPAILLKWLYENVPELYEKVLGGEAFAWTLDSYLLYQLTGRYVSDITSSAMTGLIHPKDVSKLGIVFSLLKLPDVIPEMLDNIADFGKFEGLDVSAAIADQQSAAVGLGVLEPRRIESVHGTGSFVEEATSDLVLPRQGLLPIVILSIDGKKTFGVEGFIRTTGSIVEWFRRNRFFDDYDEMEELASRGERNSIVLPAFGGFKTPRSLNLRGIIAGLGLDTRREDILSGLAWGVALHIALIVKLLSKYAGPPREPLWSAGGYSKSDSFLQTLADATGMRVARSADIEASSMGVAKLLALSDGVISRMELLAPPRVDKVFTPRLHEEEREDLLTRYSKLLEASAFLEEISF